MTVNEVLDGHVALDLECLDRIYLNAYVPNLQVGGQVVSFLTAHLGYPIPSPAIFDKIGTAFRQGGGPLRRGRAHPGGAVHQDRPQDREDAALPRRAGPTGRSGVAAIGVAQEYASVFTGTKKTGSNGVPWFSFTKADRRVSCYYFYLWDDEFGPAFIKICAYFPYPAKIWINGHEWAKRQALHAGIGFTELSNGFAATDDPAGLQAICDRLGPDQITAFAQRWFAVLPVPLTDADAAGGLLVGAVDAPDRGLAHHRVHRAAPRPRVLRGPGRRQPRHRPPRTGRADLPGRRTRGRRPDPQRSRPRSSPAASTSP